MYGSAGLYVWVCRSMYEECVTRWPVARVFLPYLSKLRVLGHRQK